MEIRDLKILAIDGNKYNLIALKAVIADRLPGARIMTAMTGPMGLELAVVQDPDVILLDIIMPEMDGFEVCRKLKEDEQLQTIPVLFLAALKTDRNLRVKALKVGAEGFVSTPFDDVELTAQILAMAKVKAANRLQRMEKEQLAELVAERTRELEQELAERKRAELALQRSEGFQRALISCSPLPIFSIDPQGNVATWNTSAEKVFGWKADEIMGKPLPIVPPDKRDEFENLFGRLMEGSGFSGVELVRQKKSGDLIDVRVSAAPVLDATGNIIGVMASAEDITESKSSEEERERLRSQLNQAQKMEVIGTLAGGIAHDFNNILSPIMGYAEMALSDIPEGDPLYRDLMQIVAASHRARELVKQILTFARETEHEKRPLCASLVIKEALGLLRSSLPSTIEIQREIPNDAALTTVLSDPTQLHQILMNLCTNSAHAMRGQGGILRVGLENTHIGPETLTDHPDAEPGPYLKVSVSDTGHGMTAEVVQRIFEPYFTTKEQGEGTGLGLATVYGIVKSHKGFISVTSEQGKGTTFDVFLPRIEVAPTTRQGAAAPIPQGQGRVLLVDDEEPLLIMAQRLLSRLGYDVVAHSSSLDAFEVFKNGPDKFDLIVTDHTMPHMTGMDFARNILQIRPDIPIVLCTGFSELITEEKAKAIGIRKLLMKPISIKELAGTASELLGTVGS